MSTVISIMDRDGWKNRTDVIVVADGVNKTLTWIPRDFWSEIVKNRINIAYALGGHKLLIHSLNKLGLKVKRSLCVLPKAISRAIADLTIDVPVSEPMSFSYPIEPFGPTSEVDKPGARHIITFSPPSEILSNERIHQWIGARFRVDGGGLNTDLERIERQQILMKRLLEKRFNFGRCFCPDYVAFSKNFSFSDLKEMDASWKLELFAKEQLCCTKIRGLQVLALKNCQPAL